jgi:hypothetical protein
LLQVMMRVLVLVQVLVQVLMLMLRLMRIWQLVGAMQLRRDGARRLQ